MNFPRAATALRAPWFTHAAARVFAVLASLMSTLSATLSALLLAGCAALTPTPVSTAAATAAVAAPAAAASAAATSAANAASVGVEIDAPPELKALLDRYLDLVRLGRLARDDVDTSEWSRLIDAAPAQVRDLLQTEGYFSPQVTLEREPAPQDGAPDIVKLKVDPGERARVGKVTLESEGELQTGATSGDDYARKTLEALREQWALPVGSDFRNAAWNDAKAAALARLRAAGYANAQWTGSGAEVDTAHNTVTLYLVADSGPLYRYASLEIEGLSAQDAKTVLNMVGASPGAPVTETLMLDFQERLQKSGLFDNANVTLDADPAHANAAKLIVRLRESPLQTYTFGPGISANTGPRATAEQSYRRLFGQALTLHNKIEYGQLRRAWDGDITSQAREGLYNNLLGGAAERLISDTDTVLSQRIRLGRSQDTQHIERLYFIEYERSLRHTFDDVINSKAIAVSLNYNGGWRGLDNYVLPTRGLTFSGQAGVGQSHGNPGEPGIFTRLYGKFVGYLPLGQNWYSQARIEVGQVFLHSTMVVPDSLQFRAGGDESVRGYGYRSLGPLVDGAVGGGNVLYTTSLELAHPLMASLPSLWGAVFMDAGNAGNSFEHLHPALGTGVGLRWRSPVGPVRVDMAYGQQVEKLRLSVSVGIVF
jgi:translocation and assembly module TamA